MLQRPSCYRQLGSPAYAEPKRDGWRILIRVSAGSVSYTTKRGTDITARVPLSLTRMVLDSLPWSTCTLDGEIYTPTDERAHAVPRGLSGKIPLELMVFDVLEADGRDLRDLPLCQRHWWLDQLPFAAPRVRYTSTAEAVKALGASEGVIVKRVSSTYASGQRNSDWQKRKLYETRTWRVVGVVIDTDPLRVRQIVVEHLGEFHRINTPTHHAAAVLRALMEWSADHDYALPGVDTFWPSRSTAFGYRLDDSIDIRVSIKAMARRGRCRSLREAVVVGVKR